MTNARFEQQHPRDELGMFEVKEYGKHFKTGQDVEFDYMRNTNKAPKNTGGFGQDIEPHGRYLLHAKSNDKPPTGWETGKLRFNNPLVLAHDPEDIYGPNGWKARLSRAFGGKKGKALSKAIAKAGYDGIVTVDPKYGETSEIVDLKMFHDPWTTRYSAMASAIPIRHQVLAALELAGVVSLPEQYAAKSATSSDIDRAVSRWKAPSEAQKDAGNYHKPRVMLHGIEVAIENPRGTRRRPEWPPLAHHYGYASRLAGAAAPEARDGDKIDIFVGPHPESEIVYVVDQEHPSGRYDEPKVLMGFRTAEEARAGYLDNYTPGWHCGPITAMTVEQFKAWLQGGDTKRRVAEQVSKYQANLSSAEQYAARGTSAGQRSVLGAGGHGERRPEKQQGLHWVTVSGHAEGDKQHVGGTPVQIDGQGNIHKGAEWATSKGATNVKHLGGEGKKEAAPEKPEKPLDHGVLNVPLDKRGGGSLDSQIDKWKLDEAAKAKAKRREDAATTKTAKARARELFDQHADVLSERTAAKHGVKVADVRKHLDSMVKHDPEKAVAIFERFLKENTPEESNGKPSPAAEIKAKESQPKFDVDETVIVNGKEYSFRGTMQHGGKTLAVVASGDSGQMSVPLEDVQHKQELQGDGNQEDAEFKRLRAKYPNAPEQTIRNQAKMNVQKAGKKPESAAEKPAENVQNERLSRNGYEWRQNAKGKWAWFSGDRQMTGAHEGKDEADSVWNLWPNLHPRESHAKDDSEDKARFSEMDKRYGSKSIDELKKIHDKMADDIASHQEAGKREFTGMGTRRTAASVSAQAARDIGQERLLLGRYIKDREEAKDNGGPSKSASKTPPAEKAPEPAPKFTPPTTDNPATIKTAVGDLELAKDGQTWFRRRSGGKSWIAVPKADHARIEAALMGAEARKAKAESLVSENPAAMSTPLMSEGAISPMQVGMMSDREKRKYQENALKRMDIESQSKELSKTDAQLGKDIGNEHRRQQEGRLAQRKSMIETMSRFKGKSGKVLPKYQREIDKMQAEVAEIEADLAGSSAQKPVAATPAKPEPPKAETPKATPKTPAKPSASPKQPRTSSAVETAITEAVGDRPRDRERFSKMLDETHRRHVEQANGENESMRQIMAQFGYSGARQSALIRAAKQAEDLDAFQKAGYPLDKMAQMIENDPSTYAGLMRQTGGESAGREDVEAMLFNRLKQGGLVPVPAKHDPTVVADANDQFQQQGGGGRKSESKAQRRERMRRATEFNPADFEPFAARFASIPIRFQALAALEMAGLVESYASEGPQWMKLGGASVQVNADGTIIKGCPGLKGEDIDDYFLKGFRFSIPMRPQGSVAKPVMYAAASAESYAARKSPKSSAGQSSMFEKQHPRAPAGAKGGHGGEFVDKGESKPSATAAEPGEFKLSNPAPKAKAPEFEDKGGKQGGLFAKEGLPGQMGLFAEAGQPKEMTRKEEREPETKFDWTPGGGSKEVKIGSTSIMYGISADGKRAELIHVETPAKKRGQGSGRIALEQFLSEADRNGVIVRAVSSPRDKKTDADKLMAFYKSLGFVPTGTATHAGDPIIVRNPKDKFDTADARINYSAIFSAIPLRHHIRAALELAGIVAA